eukprot:1178776-Prorocentrum_minimum.AAC.3
MVQLKLDAASANNFGGELNCLAVTTRFQGSPEDARLRHFLSVHNYLGREPLENSDICRDSQEHKETAGDENRSLSPEDAVLKPLESSTLPPQL